jgi:predicted  nucleic acid-binding Zn-ribbon protein
MIDFDALLALQAHDTSLDQLRHRHEHLPERAEIVELAAASVAQEAAAVEALEQQQELQQRERRFEDEASTIEAKAASENTRLYSGTITGNKELQDIQTEIESLHRRQAELEDEALVLMELLVPVNEQVAVDATKAAEISAASHAATELLATTEQEIAAAIETAISERVQIAAGIDDALLTTYEKVRVQGQGVAVSRLVGDTCDGCHLGLAAVELDRVRHEPSDVLVFHEECGRIIVR